MRLVVVVKKNVHVAFLSTLKAILTVVCLYSDFAYIPSFGTLLLVDTACCGH